MYQLNTQDGCIVSIVSGVSAGNITEREYLVVKAALAARPAAPEGYTYRLRTDLAWELYELPPEPEEDLEEPAAEGDYQAALAEMGVGIHD